MNTEQRIRALDGAKPKFLDMLGGKIVGLDPEKATCTFNFVVPLDFCHTISIVQGGFVAAMLDAAASHAVFAIAPDVTNVSTLELDTRYLGVTRGETPLIVVGRVDKLTWKTAFLSGEITNEEGEVTAMVTAVAKIVRQK